MSEENKKPEVAQPAAPAGGPSVPPTGPGTQVGAELTVQDLSVIKTIIEVASQRGAFKATELEAVGKTFNKLDSFLTTVANQQVNAQIFCFYQVFPRRECYYIKTYRNVYTAPAENM